MVQPVIYSAGAFVAISIPAWMFLRSRKIKNSSKPSIPAADSAFEDAETICVAEYAEELEKLLASLLASLLPNNPSSSGHGAMNLEVFCGICLENKASGLMFSNEKCDHSFCYECTTSYITTKIQEKVENIACPAPDCDAKLASDACRLIIPRDALVQWDELRCLSLIPDSQKLYCPFRDCSALMVNEFGKFIRSTNCVVCKRRFCAQCRVPWHTFLTCEEFKKAKLKKSDDLVKELAVKKRWPKCPGCKMYVERNFGCNRMTCRCGYQFCYICGDKWSSSHTICWHKS